MLAISRGEKPNTFCMDIILANPEISTNQPSYRLQLNALITIHRHSLGASAQFSVRCRADRSTTSMSSSAALLECKQLFSTESLVVDLRSGVNQILEVGSGKEVSEVDKFAVVFILNIDDSPSVLTPTDLLASNDDRLLGSNDGEWNNVLYFILEWSMPRHSTPSP